MLTIFALLNCDRWCHRCSNPVLAGLIKPHSCSAVLPPSDVFKSPAISTRRSARTLNPSCATFLTSSHIYNSLGGLFQATLVSSPPPASANALIRWAAHPRRSHVPHLLARTARQPLRTSDVRAHENVGQPARQHHPSSNNHH
jgi:hypothetical protein